MLRSLTILVPGASVALKTSLTSLMTKVKDASSRVEKALSELIPFFYFAFVCLFR